MKVAATQMDIILGDVRQNFENARELIKEASSNGAELIVLPEFFTSGMAINPVMDKVFDLNKKYNILKELKKLSSDFNIIISGSILNEIQNDIYNSIFIIEPNEKIFIHNKDIPTQFENCYYTDGDVNRNYKKFGLAYCWEMLRTKTIKELNQEIEVLLCGSCWWDLPIESKNIELRNYNHELNIKTPQLFARLVGVPVIHSSLIGIIEGEKDLENNNIVKRELIGTTQIIDAEGDVLQAITGNTGNAYIIEDLKFERRVIKPIEDSFWITQLRDEYITAWDKQNKIGKEIYKRKYKRN